MTDLELVAAALSGRWDKPVVAETFGTSVFVVRSIRRGKARQALAAEVKDLPAEKVLSPSTIAKLDRVAASAKQRARANYLKATGRTFGFAPKREWMTREDVAAAVASKRWPISVMESVTGTSRHMLASLDPVDAKVSDRLAELLNEETLRRVARAVSNHADRAVA